MAASFRARGGTSGAKGAGLLTLDWRAATAGIGALLLAASMVLDGGGCSAESSSSGNPGLVDGSTPGADAGVSLSDSGTSPVDAAPASDAGAADGGEVNTDAAADSGIGGPTTLLVVHASANLFPFRVCFGDAPASTPPTNLLPFPAYPDDPARPMPETNIPGVPVGGAALLPSLPLAGRFLTPYVLRAEALDDGIVNETTCDRLFCGVNGVTTSCFNKGDYAALPRVLLPVSGSAVLAVQGCPAQAIADLPGSAAQCGATYDPATGNLSALALPFFPPTGDGLALETAQLSPSFSGTDAGFFLFVDPTLDASIPLALSSDPPWLSTVPLSDAGVLSASFIALPASGPPVAQSLASVQYFQSPASDPGTYFNAGSRYFTAIVGDATDAAAPATLLDGAANPSFDGHGLHVIAYPAN